MLLIYRDLFVGSATDVRSHLEKLEVIGTHLDVSSICTPTLLRAWRMLLYDIRTRTMPTRKSAFMITIPTSGAPWDSQLAIRELYSSIWALQMRFVIETSFDGTDVSSKGSASQSAARWLYSVLGRRCDLDQLEQSDYYEERLSTATVAAQCHNLESCLDNWYRSLPPQGLPTPRLGTAHDIITGPSFGSIVPYQFTDERTALDYISYLISRMMCGYLESRLQERVSVSSSQAWAWVVLGIAATIGLRKHQFFGPSIFALLLTTSMMSEGTVILTAIVDGLLPQARARAHTPLEAAEFDSLQKALELIIQERNRGKAIRAIVPGFDEHEKLDKLFDT